MQETATSFRIPKSVPQLPALFSGFINEHYRKAFIWGINTVVDAAGQFVYKVELSDSSTLYHLLFNLDGALIEEKKESMI